MPKLKLIAVSAAYEYDVDPNVYGINSVKLIIDLDNESNPVKITIEPARKVQ